MNHEHMYMYRLKNCDHPQVWSTATESEYKNFPQKDMYEWFFVL